MDFIAVLSTDMQSPLLRGLPAGMSAPTALLLITTAWLTAAVSATFGLGGGMILLAVLLSVMNPVAAIPVHGVLQLGANASRSWFMRRDVLRAVVLWFLPGCLAGVGLASLVVVDIPVRWLTLGLASFILWAAWRPASRRRRVRPIHFSIVGLGSAFLTMFVGATGPMIAAFLPPEKLGRHATVATQAACMTSQHLMKVVAFGLLGFSLADWLPLVGVMLVAGLAGSYHGKHLLERIPETVFRRGFRIVLTVLALRLLYQATLGDV